MLLFQTVGILHVTIDRHLYLAAKDYATSVSSKGSM